MTVRVLVTCSRSWSAWSVMREALEKVHATHPDATQVHGAAPHGDRDAARIWRGLGGAVEPWPADWTRCDPRCRHRTRQKLDRAGLFQNYYCPYAGYRRNIAMVESAPDMALAFIRNKSRGATHCAGLAEDAGIPTVRYVQENPNV